ncbi:hypothetical protein VMCG_07137 [Cytospora schulzeri]|uniref:Ricin B lectin domain-containing protein n=1 Tax=Cytospora schulzeri TaxID=448051 RepID=A0A423W4W8_9PEZI|nr:hypothetical protein VMCG_07137 [Valsa malicola]
MVMENHGLLQLTSHAYGFAEQLAVVVIEDLDPDITVTDLQGAVAGTGASGWDLHFDQKSLKTTLEVRFEDKERADSFTARFDRLFDDWFDNELKVLNTKPKATCNTGQWSPTMSSSTMDRNIQTPDSTTADGLSDTTSTAGIDLLSDEVPWPGETYKIQHRDSRRLITLEEGELRLRLPSAAKAAGGCHWVCVEKNGWLGFRSPVSATYMGHDNKGAIWCKKQHHKSYESFCVRRHPDGGYVILVKHHEGLELCQLAVDEASGKIVERSFGEPRARNTQWLFEAI